MLSSVWQQLVTDADGHEGLAAWVQAIGTIGAIFATWWLSSLNSRSERARDDRAIHARARAIAIAQFPRLASIKAHVKKVRHYAQGSDFGLKDRLMMSNVQARLTVPEDLDTDKSDDLWALPPDAAKAIAQTSYYLWQYNDFIQSQIPGLGGLNEEQIPIYRHRAESYLRSLETISTEAVEIFSALHDS